MKFCKLFLILAMLAITWPARAALNGWEPLSIQEQAATGFNYRGVFDATNFTGLVTNAANSAANTLFPRPGVGTINFDAGFRVRNWGLKVTTPFATSGGATAVALNIGDSTATNRFLSAVAIGTNITAGTWYVGGNTNYIYNTATNLTIHLLPVGDVNANLNAGRVEVYFQGNPLNNIAQ